jgi:hypothetical protein
VNLKRSRDLGYQALERHEREQALGHQLDGFAPSRRAGWPNGDPRSGSRSPDDAQLREEGPPVPRRAPDRAD